MPQGKSRTLAARTRQFLQIDLLGDFPFVDNSDKAHAIALLLQPFVRSLIEGPTPLHLIEKPTPGTGATLLAEMLLYPTTGHSTAAMSEGRDEDEWRKRITAKLLAGPSVVLIDNLKRRLDSAALSAAITTSLWEDRLLGRSEMVRVPVHCAWAATGNNPTLSNEMVRRTIRIRLDAKVDQPWLREGFRHPNLRQWASHNRPGLICASLVLIQAWISAGRPAPLEAPTLGQFEAWSEVMGGILQYAGIHGFLSNMPEFYETSDAEGAALRRFVELWWETHADSEVAVANLWNMASTAEIEISLGDGNERSQKTRLGILVAGLRDRQFRGLRVVAGPRKQGARTWKLEKTPVGTL